MWSLDDFARLWCSLQFGHSVSWHSGHQSVALIDRWRWLQISHKGISEAIDFLVWSEKKWYLNTIDRYKRLCFCSYPTLHTSQVAVNSHNVGSILNLIVKWCHGILQVLLNHGCVCGKHNYSWIFVLFFCFLLFFGGEGNKLSLLHLYGWKTNLLPIVLLNICV